MGENSGKLVGGLLMISVSFVIHSSADTCHTSVSARILSGPRTFNESLDSRYILVLHVHIIFGLVKESIKLTRLINFGWIKFASLIHFAIDRSQRNIRKPACFK